MKSQQHKTERPSHTGKTSVLVWCVWCAGNSFLWGLGALEEPNRERPGFLIMPKRPHEWRVDTHGCCQHDNAALGFGPRDQTAHVPVFLHLRTTNLPGPDSIMRSEHAQQRRMERRHHRHERLRRRRS